MNSRNAKTITLDGGFWIFRTAEGQEEGPMSGRDLYRAVREGRVLPQTPIRDAETQRAGVADDFPCLSVLFLSMGAYGAPGTDRAPGDWASLDLRG